MLVGWTVSLPRGPTETEHGGSAAGLLVGDQKGRRQVTPAVRATLSCSCCLGGDPGAAYCAALDTKWQLEGRW